MQSPHSEQSNSSSVQALPKKEMRRTSWSTWLGTSMEYYDLTLYGLAAALVFGPQFFPEQDPAVALLSSFAIYGSGFLIRPLGGIYFGYLGDKLGRKFVLVVTIAMMGIGTAAIGLLPTYAQAGLWAPALLVVLRLVQGFGSGAELAGASLLMVESAPTHKRGLFGAIVGLGTNSGTLLATASWTAISLLPQDVLMDWGWRIPFVASIITTAVAMYLRVAVKESPVFVEIRQNRAENVAATKAQTSLWADVKASKRTFIVTLAIRIAENSGPYLIKTFLVGYVAATIGIHGSAATTGILIGTLLGFAVIPLTGHLTDRFGRKPVYLFWTIFQFLFIVPALALIHTENAFWISAVFVVFICGSTPGPFVVETSWFVEIFGAKRRYTFMSLVKEVGSIFAGGLAPFIAAAVVAASTDSWLPIAIVMMAYPLIGIIGAIFAPETRGRDLTLEQDAF
ncbi:Inner membrane metabolite transport protein YdfJ [Gulosibacter molinativorax]|nr:Inner membrane metabolite transport protein YdfJ [Gulosibacter molinativorax]